MDLVRALKFPLDDEDWPVKIAIGSLVTLIPVVGWIGSLGYQVSVARNVIRGSARPLPGSDDLGQIFSDGVMAGIAALLYAIPMIPFWCMMALLSGIADGSSAGDFALACLSVGAVVLSIVYSIPAATSQNLRSSARCFARRARTSARWSCCFCTIFWWV